MSHPRTNLFALLAVLVCSTLFTPMAFAADSDGDGFDTDPAISSPPDCNDGDKAINPDAVELCNDTVDSDCDGDNAPDEAGCVAASTPPAAAPSTTAPSSTPAKKAPATSTPAKKASTKTSGTCPAGTACAPTPSAREALAKKWNAKYDKVSDKITCTVPAIARIGAGENCWSVDFEKGRPWNWDTDPKADPKDKAEHASAPMRWSRSSGAFVSRGTFYAIDKANNAAGIAKLIEKLEAQLATKANSTEVTELSGKLTALRGEFDAYVSTNDGELETIKRGLADVQAALPRLKAVEDKVARLEAHMKDIDDTVENLRRRPNVFHGFSVGLLTGGGTHPDPVEREDGVMLYYRSPAAFEFVGMLDLGFCNPNDGHCLTTSVGGGAGYDTGFGLNAFGSIGPEFLLPAKDKSAVSMGFHLGAAASSNGVVNGGTVSADVEGTIHYRIRLRPPVEAPGTFSAVIDLGVGLGQLAYEGRRHEQFSARGFARLTVGLATMNGKAPAFRRYEDTPTPPRPAAAP